jgi:hypothetical protein
VHFGSFAVWVLLISIHLAVHGMNIRNRQGTSFLSAGKNGVPHILRSTMKAILRASMVKSGFLKERYNAFEKGVLKRKRGKTLLIRERYKALLDRFYLLKKESIYILPIYTALFYPFTQGPPLLKFFKEKGIKKQRPRT